MWQSYTFFIILVAVIGLFIFYLGDYFALSRMTIVQVTPSQLSSAMDNDDFFSKFRYDTVVFDGLVTSVYKYGNTQVAGIYTNTKFKLNCQITLNQVAVGRTYHFMSEAYRASRQTNGVLLHNCMSF